MKLLAAVVRLLVTLALIAAIGYNTWQIRMLQDEVAVLRRRQGLAPRAGVAESLERLRKAQRHAERAETLLRAKRFDEARREAAQASALLQQAGSGLGIESVTEPLAQLQKTVGALSEKAGALWDANDAVKEKKK
jgi:hypothetical protein